MRRLARAAVLATALLVGCSAPATGVDPVVPALFEPVTVQPAGEGQPLRIRVWGRSYRFERGPLPSSIESQGRELLAAPPAFEARVDGTVRSPVWSSPQLVAASPTTVRLRSTASLAGLAVAAETTIEDDGMIRVDLDLAASRSHRLEAWRYQIALRRDLGDLFFNHHVEYDYQHFNIDKPRMIHSAGFFPAATRRLPFVPTVSVASRDVGIEWWSESDAAWVSPAGFEPIELDGRGDAARLRVEPVAAPLQLVAGQHWRDRFALFPMPMRAAPAWSRSVRVLPWGQAARYDRGVGTRFAWIAFGRSFQARWHGLPTSARNETQRELRKRVAKAGVAYIPYGKLTVAPTLHSQTLARFEDWSANGKWFVSAPPGDERAVLDLNGVKLRPRQPYTYAVCMGRRDYLDWLLEQNLEALRSEGLGGLYFDHGAISRMCTQSPLLRGRKGRQVWEYFNVRDFYRGLWRETKRIDPDALIVLHLNGQPRALAAYADFVFVGESWNVVFSAGSSRRRIAADPAAYQPDYFSLPEGYLEAMLLPRPGGAIGVLPQIKPAVDPKDPSRGRRFQRGLLAVTLVDDVPVWFANADHQTLRQVYQAIDRFGGMGGATFHPWWSNQSQVKRDPRLRVSVYVRNGAALLVASNWGAEPLETELSLDRAALGIRASAAARDAEQPSVRLRAERGVLRVRVPPRDFRLILLQ